MSTVFSGYVTYGLIYFIFIIIFFFHFHGLFARKLPIAMY